MTEKIKCGICHSWGLFGGTTLHPQTRYPTSRCTTCRENAEVVVSRPSATLNSSNDSIKQNPKEEKQ